MDAKGRITASGLTGRNPAVGVEVDLDGVKRKLDYKFKWRGCSAEEAAMIADLVTEAQAASADCGVELKQKGFGLAFSGVGDMAAVMQVLLDLCETLGEYGMELAAAEGGDAKAQKAKAARKAKHK